MARYIVGVWLLLLCAPTLFAQDPAAAPPTAEDLRLEIEATVVERPEGPITVVRLFPIDYLLEAHKPGVVQRAVRGLNEPILLVLHGAYHPDLLDSSGADTSLVPYPGLRSLLHALCYTDVDYDRPDYKELQRVESQCYTQETIAYLRGERGPFLLYDIWGENLEHTGELGYVRYVVIALTLILLTLPQLALYLGIIALLRGVLRPRPGTQRVVKVVLPLVMGIGWMLLTMMLLEPMRMGTPGERLFVACVRFWIPMSGVFFALTFIADMWLCDHLFFPENEPPALWVVVLFYVLGPVLILAAGGAGGGRGRSTNHAGPSTASGGTRVSGGGGQFGGGGAGGSW